MVRIVADVVLHEDVLTARSVVAGIKDAQERYRTMTDVAIRLALAGHVPEAQAWINCLDESLGQMRAVVWVPGAFASYGRMEEARAWIEWLHSSEHQGMAQTLVARELACRGDAAGAREWARMIQSDPWRAAARDLLDEVLGARKEPMSATAPGKAATSPVKQTFKPVQPDRHFRLIKVVQDGSFRCASVVFGLAGWDLVDEEDQPGAEHRQE